MKDSVLHTPHGMIQTFLLLLLLLLLLLPHRARC
jgi:hypothetical protein